MKNENSSTKTYLESVRINSHEREMVQRAADAAGMTKHRFMRDAIINKSKRALNRK